jgi:hypothetical protein
MQPRMRVYVLGACGVNNWDPPAYMSYLTMLMSDVMEGSAEDLPVLMAHRLVRGYCLHKERNSE